MIELFPGVPFEREGEMLRRESQQDGTAKAPVEESRQLPPQPATASPIADLTTLQGLAGNRAVCRVMQPKLSVGPADDPLEHDADEVARRVVRGILRRTVGGSDPNPADGCPATTDARSAISRQFDPIPFTAGRDIFFHNPTSEAGPDSGPGASSHELTHVVQRDGAPAVRREIDDEPGAFNNDDQPGAPRAEDVQSLADIDTLSLDAINAISVESLVPYRIIHDVFHQSWHVVKEELLAPAATPEATTKRRALMKRLLAYRDWHHQTILKEVQAELEKQKGEGALLPSKGAGSETLTSDIDVNLKGAHTELAVAAFNRHFKAPAALPNQTWDFEPGVVYDVNVYAIDFMHQFAPVEMGSQRVTLKEGATGEGVGGITNASLAADDRRDQLATSLFKNRLFMTQAQFDEYRASSLRGLSEEDEAPLLEAFIIAEERFAGYLAEMAAQMGGNADQAVDKAASGVRQLQQRAEAIVPGQQGEDHHAVGAKREDVLMHAANRIYERKLEAIHTRRAVLKNLITMFGRAKDDADRATIQGAIDQSLLELRHDVSEAAMYANEASMTDATIHHGVVGIQGGKEIDQRKHEGIDALNEHLADIHKEAARYGGFGEGAYKSGKYLMRLGDAARNLGFGYVWGVQALYDAGRKISVDIKGEADKGPYDTTGASALAIQELTGASSLDALLRMARDVAAAVTQEYMQERSAETRAGGPDTAMAFGHRTVKKGEANTRVLNKNMVHPADRAREPGAQSEMELAAASGDIGDFAFRLTEAELAALRTKWAKGA